jgi:hypothetical protein
MWDIARLAAIIGIPLSYCVLSIRDLPLSRLSFFPPFLLLCYCFSLQSCGFFPVSRGFQPPYMFSDAPGEPDFDTLGSVLWFISHLCSPFH